MTKSGEIIYEEKGNIYVKGILVTNQNVLLSYDIQNL